MSLKNTTSSIVPSNNLPSSAIKKAAVTLAEQLQGMNTSAKSYLAQGATGVGRITKPAVKSPKPVSLKTYLKSAESSLKRRTPIAPGTVADLDVADPTIVTYNEMYPKPAGVGQSISSPLKQSIDMRKTPVNLGKPLTEKDPTKINWKQRLSGFVNDNAGKLVPYMSNIANTVMGPTRPRMGTTISSRKITAPSFDATRNAIEASESAIQRGAAQSVDGNTAQAVGLAARAQTLNSLNQLAEQEGNVKANVGARQASMDMYADQFNASVVNKYNDDMVDYGNTRTSQTLANLSNASDKFIAAGNVKAMMELDERKAGILGETYKQVRDYVNTDLKKKGLFRRGGKLKLYA